jgi:hypothetical protein
MHQSAIILGTNPGRRQDSAVHRLVFTVDSDEFRVEFPEVQPIDFMDPIEPKPEVQSPAQRAGIVAALACWACVIYLVRIGEPAMEGLRIPFAGLMVFTLLPMTLTFTILHGSCIHREMKTSVRAMFLFMVALAIFCGACLFAGIFAFMAGAVLPLSRFHY